MIFLNTKPELIRAGTLLPDVILKFLLIALFVTLVACDKEPVKLKEIIRPAKIITVTAGGEAAQRIFPGEREETIRQQLYLMPNLKKYLMQV